MHHHPPVRAHRRAAAVAVVALLGAVAGLTATAGAAPPTTDPATGADLAADWLATQVAADGSVEGFGGTPDGGATLDVALSFAATGSHEDVFDRNLAWLEANVETVIAGLGADSPAAMGSLLLVLDAAGEDPTDFGGVDVPARLAATLGLHTPGLYGAADPTFDGAYRQGLALLGLEAHGITPPASAVTWLVDQQCDATNPAADGGWLPYRADTSVACPAPDPVGFSGPDTNQTAMAVQALVALGQAPAHDPLPFLADAQGADGGFAYLAGGTVDPNSTTLVIQALVAAGQDPSAAPWAGPGGSPLTSLLSWQLGDAPDLGALSSPFSGGAPDLFATRQAAWGLARAPFPLGPADFPQPTTTTTSGEATTSTTAGGTTSTAASSAPAAAPAAAAVTASARYTG